jgi:hypothetical protein
LRDEIAQVHASLPAAPEGGTAPMSNTTAEIRRIRVYPHEVQPGDFVQRADVYGSLKVGYPPRRMGDVYRLEGTSRKIGTEVIYPKAGVALDVVRGYPVGTLPEQDSDRDVFAALALVEGDE